MELSAETEMEARKSCMRVGPGLSSGWRAVEISLEGSEVIFPLMIGAGESLIADVDVALPADLTGSLDPLSIIFLIAAFEVVAGVLILDAG
jgi:hypothetical protein